MVFISSTTMRNKYGASENSCLIHLIIEKVVHKNLLILTHANAFVNRCLIMSINSSKKPNTIIIEYKKFHFTMSNVFKKYNLKNNRKSYDFLTNVIIFYVKNKLFEINIIDKKAN